MKETIKTTLVTDLTKWNNEFHFEDVFDYFSTNLAPPVVRIEQTATTWRDSTPTLQLSKKETLRKLNKKSPLFP